jgi:hypothetical protein
MYLESYVWGYGRGYLKLTYGMFIKDYVMA